MKSTTTVLLLTLCVYHAMNLRGLAPSHPMRFLASQFELRDSLGPLLRLPTLILDAGDGAPIDRATTRWASLAGAFAESLGETNRAITPPAWRDTAGVSAASGDLKSGFSDDVARFIRECVAHGVTPIVLPIPDAFIGADRPPARGKMPAYEALVGSDPRHFVDLAPALRAGFYKDGTPLFAHDRHWTSFGISVAVKAVVEHLRGLDVTIVPDARTDHPTCFYAPVLAAGGMPAPRKVVRDTFYGVSARALPAAGIRLVSIGTSFGAKYVECASDFSATLASVLKLPYVRFGGDGTGTFGGMSEMVKRGFALRRGDVVVWEFPLYAARQTLGDDDRRLPELIFR